MTPYPPFRTAVLLTAALCLAGCCRAALAQETPTLDTPSSPDASARSLTDEAMRKAGGGDLGDWTRSILDRALERAGETARQTVPGSGSGAGPGSIGEAARPLPAERHAGRIFEGATGHGATAEILIFTSLSVPAASWRQWARDAAKIGVPLVLRGVGVGGLRETAKRIGDRLGGHDAGVAIDPRLFRLFGIVRVPAVVVVPGGGPGRSPARVSPVPPCESRGCADDPAPPHDLVTGNIGLIAALEAVAAEGDAGRAVAKTYLEGLGREP